MKTGKPPWKKRILPAAALALAAPVLFFAFSLAAHLVSVADFGYPGGEMDFMGLRTRMASTYFQILEFDARGIVVAQRACRYSDAP